MKMSPIRVSGQKVIWATLGVIWIAAFAMVDMMTSERIRLAIFYVVGVGVATWRGGTGAGIIVALTGMVAGNLVDHVVMKPAMFPTHTVNVLLNGCFLFATVAVFSRLREQLSNERRLARRDSLTGIANRQAFLEAAQREVYRCARYGHPLSACYLDCDDFKRVNDEYGHGAGDRLLKIVGGTIQGNLRRTDLVARIGGDEFAILLPETGFGPAHEGVTKLMERLRVVMKKYNWPVTFSLGLVTFIDPPESVEDVLRRSDELMLSSKREGKDRFSAALYVRPEAQSKF